MREVRPPPHTHTPRPQIDENARPPLYPTGKTRLPPARFQRDVPAAGSAFTVIFSGSEYNHSMGGGLWRGGGGVIGSRGGGGRLVSQSPLGSGMVKHVLLLGVGGTRCNYY